MKIPNFASLNQSGMGRLSTESQVGSYVCAPRGASNETASSNNFIVRLMRASNRRLPVQRIIPAGMKQ